MSYDPVKLRMVIYILCFLFCIIAAHFACGQVRYSLPCSQRLASASLQWERNQVGVKEATGNNDGEPIETWQRLCGAHKGDPYCACFQSAAFVINQNGDLLPFRATPLARGILSQAMHGKREPLTPTAGDCMVWKHATGISGHVGRIVRIGANGWVETVEANTSSGTGNQRDGDGVYLRKRNWRIPLGRMVLGGFIHFQ